MKDITIKRNDIKNFILYLLLLLPFFKSNYLIANYPLTSKIYFGWQLISFVLILLFIIQKKQYSKIINYILIYCGILLLSSIINNYNILSCLESILNTITICLIVDHGINNNLKVFLNSWEFLLVTLVLINFITILMYPSGMYVDTNNYYTNWFLGYKNAHIIYIMPAILVSFCNSYLTFNKFRLKNYLLLIISFISTYLVSNSTGLVGLGIIILLLLMMKVFKKSKVFNILSYSIIYVASFLSIVVLRFQNTFSYLIENVLNKDLTFTGRTAIWDKVISSIKQKLFLGHGFRTFQYSKHVFTTHNTILDIIYKTGLLGLISYVLVLYQSCKQLWINRKEDISKFISLILFAYFIMMLMEAYSYEYIMYILVLGYNVKQLLEGSNKHERIN